MPFPWDFSPLRHNITQYHTNFSLFVSFQRICWSAVRKPLVAKYTDISRLPVYFDAKFVVHFDLFHNFVQGEASVIAKSQLQWSVEVGDILHARPGVEPHGMISNAAV